ncbi:CRISP/Allergen/PR-1-like [Dermacentor variabilis]|uniref:CRISP/Allergen/PR-1-like n=1 Tax=Dermacentor variabilis TaxID=34621 RepID=UPI003F5B8EB7
MSSRFISTLVLLLSSSHSLEPCRAECRAEYQKLSEGGVTHTACKAPNLRCRILDRGLRGGEAEEILRLHNNYRSQMALGLVPGFKPAANMHQLLWDAGLAEVAQAHADQCSEKRYAEHDKKQARVTARFPRVGQNVGWRGENRNRSSATWSQRIKNWFDEYKDYPPEGIASFKVIRGPPRTGHFTQLMWGETRFVGCGYTFYRLENDDNAKRYQTTQVCNYGPRGNILTEPVYSEGQPCSSCFTEGFCNQTTGLCTVTS